MRSRLPGTGTTIFSVMSRLAADHGAINLSQGFPDYSPEPRLFERVRHYMDAGFNQYAPMAGEPRLLGAIAAKIGAELQAPVDAARQLCITAGATQAIFTAIQALVHPGDEVIVFDPAFDIYAPAIALSGGRAIHMPLEYPAFQINWSDVEGRITPRTRVVIINSPHNPTGSVLAPSDLLALASLTERHDLHVISDEVYEHLVYDGKRHESVLRYPELARRSIAAFSFGKTFHITGWKVGYAVGPPELMHEFRKVHQFVVFSVNRPVQLALADYLADPDTYRHLPAFFQEKRDRFTNLLGASRFRMEPSAGTYFQLADYSAISDLHDMEFCRELTVKHGVAAIPVSPFYANGSERRLVRFCFAKTNDILEQAAERLCKI